MGLIIGMFVLLRLVSVILTPLNLGPDEAQYWRWADHLDWGYYSKPPLIAWTIAFTTSLFGQAEWAVRFFAPIGHGLAAFCLFLLGKQAFDTRTGVLAAFIYLLMPGVWLSSGIISTDGLLLPCLCAGLLMLWRQREDPNWLQGALLGLAIGVAFLAKYAAIYFLLGAGLLAIIDPQTRRSLFQVYSLGTLLTLVAVIGPNLAWNAANDFATVNHTADNANWENSSYNLSHFPRFLLDQMGVFGPVSFVLLMLGMFFILPNTDSESAKKDRWFLCFVLPPLIVIAIQAVISRAHANWAASAYPSASVLLAAWALRANWSKALKAGLALNLVAGLFFVVLSVNPKLADATGFSNAFKRARGWEESVDRLVLEARNIGAVGIVFDERENWHGMDYYGRDVDNPPAHYLWRRLDSPHAFAESHAPVPEGTDETLMVASIRESFRPLMREDFKSFQYVGQFTIALGGGKERTFCLHKASGYNPVQRTRAFEIKFRGVVEACGPDQN